jgi:EAL domain-containing protein (putative c-di-GMP-specific phosphodiesterase class I)
MGGLQGALEEAVACSAFTLAYQPIVALTSGELAGFEALVRWPHPQWGMMQPDQFISLAEETGQIVPLGSWVLARAAADLARWRQDPRGIYVSVNVSARQFSAPGFVDGVRRVLAAAGLEPGALMLELTESVLLRRDERMHADLAQLKAIGVRLAIDDFGTGYSSLSYLGTAHRRAEDGQVLRGRDRGLRAAPRARRGHRPDRQDAAARGHR